MFIISQQRQRTLTERLSRTEIPWNSTNLTLNPPFLKSVQVEEQIALVVDKIYMLWVSGAVPRARTNAGCSSRLPWFGRTKPPT